MVKVFIGKIDYNYVRDNQEFLINLLYKDRQDKVSKILIEKPRLTSIYTGIMLQEILLKYYKCDITKLNICRNDQGKPYIEAKDIRFNISHSDGFIVIAVSNCQVGIDIELIEKDGLKIAKRCFSNEEYQFILNSKDVTGSFNRIWTMKEAYLKFTGEGISRALNSFTVNPLLKVVTDKSQPKCVNILGFCYIDEELIKRFSSSELNNLGWNSLYGISLCSEANCLDKIEIVMYNNHCCKCSCV